MTSLARGDNTKSRKKRVQPNPDDGTSRAVRVHNKASINRRCCCSNCCDCYFSRCFGSLFRSTKVLVRTKTSSATDSTGVCRVHAGRSAGLVRDAVQSAGPEDRAVVCLVLRYPKSHDPERTQGDARLGLGLNGRSALDDSLAQEAVWKRRQRYNAQSDRPLDD